MVQAVVQAGCRATASAQPGGRQLDRQRYPVQPPEDRHHHRPGLLVNRQADALRSGRSANNATASEDPAGGPVSPGPGSDSDGTR